ncbi:PREDICTED: uncharacterized protein LOC106321859, partial [Brassica oleracea var. oleracea]
MDDNDFNAISRFLVERQRIRRGNSSLSNWVVDLFRKNPRYICDPSNPQFAMVHSGTDDSSRVHGCASENSRIKRILKFCEQRKPREYRRVWVMEEYTLPKDWGKEECYVFTKVTCMFQAELNILLDKHFSRLCVSRGTKSWKSTIPKEQLSLPVYGVALASVERQDLYYADTIMKSWGPKWPTYATNDVYSKFPSDLVDFKDPKSSTNGYCFYVNKFDAGGETCEWLMTPQDEDRMIYSKVTGKIVGKVRTFTCLESVSREEEMVSWVMEEYSVLMNMKKGK